MLRIVRQAQNHVMILAAVKFCPKQLRAVQQLSGKYAEMTNIVVGAQVVDGIIRLEVHRDHLVDVRALKRRLIAVNKVRILFVDRLYIFVKCAGMQNIVVVKQPDKLAGCKLSSIRSCCPKCPRFWQASDKRFSNPAPQPFAVFADIGVRIVRTVRQTQLPVFVRFCHWTEPIISVKKLSGVFHNGTRILIFGIRSKTASSCFCLSSADGKLRVP